METNNKLREALVSVKKSIDEIGAASLVGDPEIMPMSLTQVCAGLSAWIETALAEPVKNCEVGTPEEQSKRFKFSKCDEPPKCRPWDECCLTCFAKWAQGPYFEEGGAK